MLDFIVRPTRDEVVIIARYSESLHRAETVRGLIDSWLAVAASVAAS
jgi:hypothetical protein